MATITVGNDRKGSKPEAGSKRHGVGLVRRLIGQVRGTTIINSDHGTV